MHTLVLQGTQTGGTDPATISLSFFDNSTELETYSDVLEYVTTNMLTLDLFTNTQTFYDVELDNIVVTELTLTAQFANVNEFYDVDLSLVVFTPVNAETTALLAASTGTYGTTAKRQIDRLITELKLAGVWDQLDWYGNAFWAVNEHDALLNWVLPSQTLTKVGGAFWTLGVGLTGLNPATASGRYKSGWNISTGPVATTTDFAMFAKVTDIFAPQNGMQLMGNLEFSSPGPAAPDGSFIILSPIANSGSGGANVAPFNGNTGFAVGDGTGVWGTSRNGGTNITVHDGTQVDSDAVTGTASYHNSEGICVVGTPPGFLAQRSFGGTVMYWGWGGHLSAAMFQDIEDAFTDAQLPPDVGGGGTDGLDVGSGDYLAVNTDGDWLKIVP